MEAKLKIKSTHNANTQKLDIYSFVQGHYFVLLFFCLLQDKKKKKKKRYSDKNNIKKKDVQCQVTMQQFKIYIISNARTQSFTHSLTQKQAQSKERKRKKKTR